MWWQTIPPFAVVLGLMSVPYVFNPVFHYVFTGRPNFQGLSELTYFADNQKHGFCRDLDMTGNEYTSRGLDHIPDDD